jgi:AcrR family transcriptional regulator
MAPRRARGLEGDTDGRSLREHLIEVTGRLLAEGGTDLLTTRKIARAAGVADGVLYNHFTDKDDLVLAALVARVTAHLDAFRDACPNAGTGAVEANLERLAAAMLELQRALLPLLVGLVGKRQLLERFLASLHASDIGGPDAILAPLDAYLAAEERLGRLRGPGDPHLAGVLLFAITQLQALVTHFRDANTSNAEAARELQPFIRFLTQTLTTENAELREQTTNKGGKK